MISLIFQNDPLDKEKIHSQVDRNDFPAVVEKEQKMVFCPACGRNVPLSFIVAGLCEDCFNND